MDTAIYVFELAVHLFFHTVDNKFDLDSDLKLAV